MIKWDILFICEINKDKQSDSTLCWEGHIETGIAGDSMTWQSLLKTRMADMYQEPQKCL